MLEDENDFLRQALLAEMEKNFVAYKNPLFLHIGARYIDQRAAGTVNDRNFMETFVRVFGKFWSFDLLILAGIFEEYWAKQINLKKRGKPVAHSS